MNGWVKIHRKFIEWEWYDDINTKTLFLHLLLKANHKDKRYRGRVVKRGALLTGRALLSVETGLSERQIRTALSRLKSTNEIAIKSSLQGSEIQVVKYDAYQVTDQQNDQQATNERPTIDQQATNNKNVKNDKNDKNKEKILKKKYGEFENVMLTDDELTRLNEKFSGTLKSKIENLSSYIAQHGKRYKSHYATILNWDRRDKKENKPDYHRKSKSYFK